MVCLAIVIIIIAVIYFNIGSHIAQGDPEFEMQVRITLDF